MAGLIVIISEAPSYLSDSPQTCMNCHVMKTAYASWQRSGHGKVATCNDCHVPQDKVYRKYLFKGHDGLRHSYAFTFRLEPQSIRIKAAGSRVVQENCERCHWRQVSMMNKVQGDERCWRCHRDVPHGTVQSLSATPYVRIPRLKSVLPITEGQDHEKAPRNP